MSTLTSFPDSAKTMVNSTAFKDFYMRPNLDSHGTVPAEGALYASPDIWLSGDQPIKDFGSVLATPESYANHSTSNVLVGKDNIIYVRGKNGGDALTSKQIELYYIPASLINWPCYWYKNRLKIKDGSRDYVTMENVGKGQIAVGNECFVWEDVPKPQNADHYCLIANVNDEKNSHPVPGTQAIQWEDMGDIIKKDLRFGWRNTIAVDSNKPDWTIRQLLSIPKNITEEKDVWISLICPPEFNGAAVAFSASDSTGSSAPIRYDKETIAAKPGTKDVKTVAVKLQPGFSASIQVNYWKEKLAGSPKGKELKFIINYEPTTKEERERAFAKNIVSKYDIELVKNMRVNNKANIEPITPVSIGGITYSFA